MGEVRIPDQCSLPTVERATRVAELRHLLGTSVLSAHRQSPRELRLLLDASAVDDARDLCARESQCCSFFSFAFEAAEHGTVLIVRVPPQYADVLDRLAAV
jgi:hypothetical protein